MLLNSVEHDRDDFETMRNHSFRTPDQLLNVAGVRNPVAAFAVVPLIASHAPVLSHPSGQKE